MQFDGPVAVCIYKGDESKTLHRESLPGLTPCGLAFSDHPLIGGVIAVIKTGKVPYAISPKCDKCFAE